ncbi:MAG: hypothetical protein CMN56_07500 [Sneathiella sp.]|uniref:hypothetical protein n=1 Tax=Sneathiella sp. TaxID=1964365 RepID=UPI000C3EF064|nr:hypothetical protein [Sneathiella sp.]MAZ02967.1 hypothetical protein [Sneathiella sp.]
MAARHKKALHLRLLVFGFSIALFSLALNIFASLALAEAENWLPPGSSTEMLDSPPPELIKPGTEKDREWLYGRLLFRSPSLLGEKAVRIGLSCNSCHTNGHVNTSFYINGLSDRPGRIDVTNRFWQAGFEDGIANPLDIPSLRGSADNKFFGTVNVFPDLHAFTSHVIMIEFAGPEPNEEAIKALISYMNSLDINELEESEPVVETSSDMSYISLLHRPLENRDMPELDRLIDLIRSDYGRRAKLPAAQTDALHLTVSSLRELQDKAAKDDFEAAFVIYRKLSSDQ